jgi:hypothetical protein
LRGEKQMKRIGEVFIKVVVYGAIVAGQVVLILTFIERVL